MTSTERHQRGHRSHHECQQLNLPQAPCSIIQSVDVRQCMCSLVVEGAGTIHLHPGNSTRPTNSVSPSTLHIPLQSRFPSHHDMPYQRRTIFDITCNNKGYDCACDVPAAARRRASSVRTLSSSGSPAHLVGSTGPYQYKINKRSASTTTARHMKILSRSSVSWPSVALSWMYRGTYPWC